MLYMNDDFVMISLLKKNEFQDITFVKFGVI